MIHAGRYAPLGKRLAEVKVYDTEGKLLGRDRQARTRVHGQKKVQWDSDAGHGARADETEARVRAMGPLSQPGSAPGPAASGPYLKSPRCVAASPPLGWPLHVCPGDLTADRVGITRTQYRQKRQPSH
ncbi:MAG: hypothetical protein OXC19_09865 [Bryobacterales bacterium]|nr:hypothetical protein [Bryobacterales bacterium]